MRMEMKEEGELRLMLDSDQEFAMVEAKVEERYGAAFAALLADLRPVFQKHGLDADDRHFIEHGVCPLLREKLWGPAKEEVLLGGRF
jgi:hypothetical protein